MISLTQIDLQKASGVFVGSPLHIFVKYSVVLFYWIAEMYVALSMPAWKMHRREDDRCVLTFRTTLDFVFTFKEFEKIV